MSTPEFPSRRPETWNDILGSFAKHDDLSDTLKAASGLILLETAEGTGICPVFQFEPQGDGYIVHPHIATAWNLLTALQIDQLGESRWTVAGMLTQSRPELEGSSWAEVLKRNDLDDAQKMPVYAAILGDAVYAAGWQGTPLIDPRRILKS